MAVAHVVEGVLLRASVSVVNARQPVDFVVAVLLHAAVDDRDAISSYLRRPIGVEWMGAGRVGQAVAFRELIRWVRDDQPSGPIAGLPSELAAPTAGFLCPPLRSRYALVAPPPLGSWPEEGSAITPPPSRSPSVGRLSTRRPQICQPQKYNRRPQYAMTNHHAPNAVRSQYPDQWEVLTKLIAHIGPPISRLNTCLRQPRICQASGYVPARSSAYMSRIIHTSPANRTNPSITSTERPNRNKDHASATLRVTTPATGTRHRQGGTPNKNQNNSHHSRRVGFLICFPSFNHEISTSAKRPRRKKHHARRQLGLPGRSARMSPMPLAF